MSSPSAPEPVLLTYEDYRALPDDGRRYELFEGELQVTLAPSTHHQRISRNLTFLLHAHVQAHDLGEVLDAPVNVILDRGTVVQPDILFVARAGLAITTARAVKVHPISRWRSSRRVRRSATVAPSASSTRGVACNTAGSSILSAARFRSTC